MNKQNINLYKKILSLIPKDLFKNNKNAIESAATDIYLTYHGVRPACAPFDSIRNDNNEMIVYGFDMTNYMKSSIGEKYINALNQIPNLKVVIGPYYDVGDVVIVYNTNKNVEPLLETIKNIRKKIDIAKTNKQKQTLLNTIHIPMGELLGYLCPIDISKILGEQEKSNNSDLYSIVYIINNREHSGVWCPINDKRLSKGFAKLKEITDVLQPLGIECKMEVSVIKK